MRVVLFLLFRRRCPPPALAPLWAPFRASVEPFFAAVPLSFRAVAPCLQGFFGAFPCCRAPFLQSCGPCLQGFCGAFLCCRAPFFQSCGPLSSGPLWPPVFAAVAPCLQGFCGACLCGRAPFLQSCGPLSSGFLWPSFLRGCGLLVFVGSAVRPVPAVIRCSSALSATWPEPSGW